jgi:hypothetical protein
MARSFAEVARALAGAGDHFFPLPYGMRRMWMKRAVVLLAVMATAVVVASGVALAANIHCPNRPDNGCEGTK